MNKKTKNIPASVLARLKNLAVSEQVDFGFGDVVTPHSHVISYPTLLDNENVNVMAYSRDTFVAEKFETIVKLTTFITGRRNFFNTIFVTFTYRRTLNSLLYGFDIK